MRTLRFAILALAALSLFAVPTRAQTVDWPASWQGIWDFDYTQKDCVTSTVIDSYSERDTLCEGSAVSDPGQICSGTINDTSVNVECSQSGEVFTGCTLTVTVTIQGTKNGNTIQGAIETNFTYTAGCGLTDTCEHEDVVGTFVSNNPGLCPSVSAGPETWGSLKARY